MMTISILHLSDTHGVHRRLMMQSAREFEDYQIVFTLSLQLPWSTFMGGYCNRGFPRM